MAEYMNPFAGLPNPQNEPDNPFMRGMMTSERRRTVQPFLDMSRQEGQIDLQKKLMQAQEFASPEAVEARRSGLTATTAKNRFDEQKAKFDFDRLPEEQKLKFAEIGNKLRKEEAQPHMEMFQELASLSDVLEKTPEQHRPLVYRQWVDRFEQTNKRPIPEKFKNYTPQVLSEAQAIKMGLVATPAHAQELEKVDRQGQNSANVARINAGSSANVARINQEGALARQKLITQEGKPRNIPQRMVELRKVLSNPNAPAEEKEVAKEEMLTYLTDGFQKYASSDPLLKSLASMAGIPGPQGEAALKRYKQELATRRQEYFQQQGMGGAAPKPQQNIEQQARQSFGSYEPEKYEYGINPQTGNFGRRLKAK